MLAKASVSQTARVAAFRCLREARRRRYGIGSLQRQRRLTEVARLTENDVSREARQRWESDPPADRYALQRLIPGADVPRVAPTVITIWNPAIAGWAVRLNQRERQRR